MEKGEISRIHESNLGCFLVMLGLSGFAISDPLLSVFGESPAIFSFYNVDTPTGLLLFFVALAFIPTIFLSLLIRLISCFSKELSLLTFFLAIFALSSLWFVQVARWNLDFHNVFVLSGLSCFFGLLLLAAYIRWSAVRLFLKLLAILPFIAGSAFLYFSETAKLKQKDADIVRALEEQRDFPSVLFLVLDEFPTLSLFDDNYEVDEERFPNLALLSGESTWYTHYSVLADKTAFSVPSILSGQKPRNEPATSARYPNNLFSLLAPTHHLTVFESVTGLCTYEACSEGPPGVIRRANPQTTAILWKAFQVWRQRVEPWSSTDLRLDDYKEALVEVKEEKSDAKQSLFALMFTPERLVNYTQAKPKRLEEFKGTFSSNSNPTLYFLHLELPHVPWRFYEDGTLYDAPVNRLALTASENGHSTWMSRVAEFRFAMQAEHTDTLVGELRDKLKLLEMWDDMLVVVTADHGRSFKPGTNARIISLETAGTIAYVPLFIKMPGQTSGLRDTKNLMSYDLLPSIAAALEIELPWPVDGLDVNHPDIALRGESKIAFPKKDIRSFQAKMDDMLTFNISETYPQLDQRFIGSEEVDEPNLRSLNKYLGLDKYFAQSVESFKVQTGGTALVEELDRIRQPGERFPMGMVMGNLAFETDAKHVLVAINGVIVTGSEIFTYKSVQYTFLAMLPNGVLKANNDIEIFLVDRDRLISLDLK